jgi:hypothetical protein
MSRTASLLVTAVAFTLVSCDGDDKASTPVSEPTTVSTAEPPGDGLFPDVVDVAATHADDGTWTFDVTISSPYDTTERYADAWRVLAPDGTELGIRELAHHHAAEQPFTRSLTGVTIPDGIVTVTIEARDQRNGWGGATVDFTLD